MKASSSTLEQCDDCGKAPTLHMCNPQPGEVHMLCVVCCEVRMEMHMAHIHLVAAAIKVARENDRVDMPDFAKQ